MATPMNVFLCAGHRGVPSRATAGAAGLDLYAAATRTVTYGDPPQLIPVGVAVEIPAGHVGWLVGRSGLALKGFGVIPGVIDSDYRGELHALAIGLTPGREVTVKAGQRIAQLVVEPFTVVEPRVTQILTPTWRGPSGFGSTGE